MTSYDAPIRSLVLGPSRLLLPAESPSMGREVPSTGDTRAQGACMRLTNTAFYTTAELADVLELKPRTIQRWIDSGQLKAYAFGRKYRIKGVDGNQLCDLGHTT